MRSAFHVAIGVVVSPLFVVLTGCALLVGAPQDNLVGGWDPNRWSVCRERNDKGVRQFSCFPLPEDATYKLLLMWTISRGSYPPASEIAAQAIEIMSKECRTFVQTVISLQTEPQGSLEQSILLEAEQTGCPDYHEGYQIRRVLYGRFTVFDITYHADTREHRDEWMKQLSEATIVFGPGP